MDRLFNLWLDGAVVKIQNIVQEADKRQAEENAKSPANISEHVGEGDLGVLGDKGSLRIAKVDPHDGHVGQPLLPDLSEGRADLDGHQERVDPRPRPRGPSSNGRSVSDAGVHIDFRDSVWHGLDVVLVRHGQ